MKRDFAESFSISFHPLLVPFYSLLFIFVLPIFEVKALGPQFQLFIIILVGITTVLLPATSMYYLKRQNIISSLKVEKRAERNIPYIMMLAYYSVASIILFRVDSIPLIIPLIIIIAGVGSLFLFLINLRIKASAHAFGMGSLGSLLLLLMYFYELNLLLPLAVVILLSIIVIISRYYLKAHTIIELILGYLLGAITSFGIGFYLLRPLFI
jgi:membrane-associated phospholipid phosphatase